MNIPHWDWYTIILDHNKRDTPFFSLKLCYEGEKLVEAVLDGTHIKGGTQP